MRIFLVILTFALAAVPSPQGKAGAREEGPQTWTDHEQGPLAPQAQRKLSTGRMYKETNAKNDKHDEDYATEEDSEQKETIAQVGGPTVAVMY